MAIRENPSPLKRDCTVGEVLDYISSSTGMSDEQIYQKVRWFQGCDKKLTVSALESETMGKVLIIKVKENETFVTYLLLKPDGSALILNQTEFDHWEDEKCRSTSESHDGSSPYGWSY